MPVPARLLVVAVLAACAGVCVVRGEEVVYAVLHDPSAPTPSPPYYVFDYPTRSPLAALLSGFMNAARPPTHVIFQPGNYTLELCVPLVLARNFELGVESDKQVPNPVRITVADGGRVRLNVTRCQCDPALNCTLPIGTQLSDRDVLVVIDSYQRDETVVTIENFDIVGGPFERIQTPLFRVGQGVLSLRNCTFSDMVLAGSPLIASAHYTASKWPGYNLSYQTGVIYPGTRRVVRVEDCTFSNVTSAEGLIVGEDSSVVVDRSRFVGCSVTADTWANIDTAVALVRVHSVRGRSSSYNDETVPFWPVVLNRTAMTNFMSEVVIRDSYFADISVPDALVSAEAWASAHLERVRVERVTGWSTLVPFSPTKSKKRVPGGGGGVHAFGDVLVRVLDSHFASNSAKFGGVMVVTASVSQRQVVTLEMRDCVFDGNVASNGAGGVMFGLGWDASDYNTLNAFGIIRNCTFLNNSATPLSPTIKPDSIYGETFADYLGLGGALLVDASLPVYVRDSHFEGSDAGNGGAVFCASCAMEIANVSFKGNHAVGHGGAVMHTQNAYVATHDSLFLDNRAELIGGAIAGVFLGGIEGNRFERCSAGVRGGAIGALEDDSFYSHYASNSLVYVKDARFESCWAPEGGAVAIRRPASMSVEVRRSTFHNCTATTGGGGGVLTATYAGKKASSQRIFLRDCHFTGNQANHGGAVALDHDGIVSGELVNSSFVGNRARTQGGGAVFVDACSALTVTDVHCEDNRAAALAAEDAKDARLLTGGCLYVRSTRRVRVSNTTFAGNAAAYGGAVHVRDTTEVLSVDGCNFTSNLAQSIPDIPSGGAGLDGGGALLVTAVGLVDSTIARLEVTASSFTDNSATTAHGGALAAFGVDVWMRACVMERNKAAIVGGGVRMGLYTQLLVESECRFRANTAGSSGGAVAVEIGGTLTVSDTSFTDNSAAQGGGAVFARVPVRVELARVLAENNVVTGPGSGGGAVLIGGIGVSDAVADSSVADVLNSTFKNNSCLGLAPGGAISVVTAGVRLLNTRDCAFVDNSVADERGGAVFVGAAPTTMSESRCTFSGNTAEAGNVVWVHAKTALSSALRDLATWQGLGSAPTELLWVASAGTEQIISSGYVFMDLACEIKDAFGEPVRWLSEPMEVTVTFSLLKKVDDVQAQLLGGEPGQLGSSGYVQIPAFQFLSAAPGLFELVATLSSASGEVARTNPGLGLVVLPCKVGQTREPGGSCRTCDIGAYTQVGGKPCRSCEAHATCSEAGHISADPGFYAFTQADGSVVLRNCLPRMCVGGTGNTTNRCAPHHSGVLCGTCDSGYVLWRGVCTACTGVNVGAVTVLVLILLLIVLYFVFVSKSSGGGWATVVFFTQATLLMFEQTVYANESNISSAVPSVLSLQLDYISGSCVAPLTIYGRFWLTLLAPVGFLLAYGLLYIVEKRLLGGSCHERLPKLPLNSQRKRERYKNAFFQLALLLYLPLSRTVLDMLNCDETYPGSGDLRLASDPSVKCSGDTYNAHRGVAIFMAIVWVYAGPLLLLLLVWIRRNSFENVRILRPFRPHRHWWVAVMELRKTVLATVYVFAELQTALLFFTYIHALLFVGHLLLQPFQSDRENQVEAVFLFLLSLGASVLSSSWYATDGSESVNTALSFLFLSVLLLVVALVGSRIISSWRLRLAEQQVADGGIKSLDQHVGITPLRHRQSAVLRGTSSAVELDELDMPGEDLAELAGPSSSSQLDSEDDDDNEGKADGGETGGGWTMFTTDDGIPYWHKDGVSVWERPDR